MSDTPPYLEVTDLAARFGIEYPVLIDSQIRELLEADFQGTSIPWSEEQDPLVMYILAPLKFLMSRYPTMLKFNFSIRPKGEDGCTKGIPVLARFCNDKQKGYYVEVDLNVNALLSDI